MKLGDEKYRNENIGNGNPHPQDTRRYVVVGPDFEAG